MLIGFQTNVKDGKDFVLNIKRQYDGQVDEYETTEGIAIIYNKETNSMTTTGCMSTEHLISAMEHIFKCVIESYKEKNSNPIEFIIDCAQVLDKLDDLINNEVEQNGSVDDFSKK